MSVRGRRLKPLSSAICLGSIISSWTDASTRFARPRNRGIGYNSQRKQTAVIPLTRAIPCRCLPLRLQRTVRFLWSFPSMRDIMQLSRLPLIHSHRLPETV